MQPDRFTIKSQEAIQAAQTLADERRNPQVTPEHLLLASCSSRTAASSCRSSASSAPTSQPSAPTSTRRSTRCRPLGEGGEAARAAGSELVAVLRAAEEEARELKRRVRLDRAPAARALAAEARAGEALRAAGATHDALLQAARPRCAARTASPTRTPRTSTRRSRSTAATSPRPPRTGKLDPVIGRDDEIRRVIQVLSRRTKNNPVLIGEPGVGKTAIVEGLAQRIVARRRARVAARPPRRSRSTSAR